MDIGNLTGLAIVLVVATIALGMGALVLDEIQDTGSITDGSYAYNATEEGLSGLDTASGFLPVIAIVVVAAIIIGIVVSSFGRGGV
jgi:hypothetical protein